MSEVLPPLKEKWKKWKESRIKQYPQNNLRASSIGHPCFRYHFYSIKNWKDKPLHDAILQSIFDEGELHERVLIQELQNMGFEVVEQQKSFQLDSPLITGHIDGILKWEGHIYPFDIKSISPFDFPKLSTSDDFLNSKKIHQRNYIAQIQIYLLMSNSPKGCLILKNKLTGEIKIIWIQIDYDFCEKLLKKANAVYEAINKNQEPDRIEDYEICSECMFQPICLPTIKNQASVSILEDDEFQKLLHKRESLKKAAKEFREYDQKIKKITSEMPEGETICGDYLIRVKEIQRKRKVALSYKEETQTIAKTQIIKLKEEKRDEGVF